MNSIEGIIFDCDGVLFASREANLAYYNRILGKFSYPPVLPEQEKRADLCHTASSPEVLRALVKPEDLQPALDYAATLDYREFIPYMQSEPDLAFVLGELSRHYPLAVATNRGTSIEPILEHFGVEQFFSVVITSCDVERPKPAPDMLLLASSRLGLAPENCLFIGDSELDQRAAEEAKVHFAGYGGLVSEGLSLRNHLQLLDHLPAPEK